LKKGKATQYILCLLLLAVLGCGCTPQVRTDYKPPLVDEGALYCYMQPLPQEMLPLAFTISDVSLVSEQGTTTPLIDEELQINGRELINIQKRLFSKTIPPGRYTAVLLSISQATIATEEGNINLLPPAQPLRIDLDFSILRGKTLALFLVLSPEYLVTDGLKFTPRFVLAKPHQHPKNYLGFISNSYENIVTVFNKRTMEIVQVIRAGVAPKGMALDQNKGLVYVALAGDDAIAIINVDSMELYGRIKLRFGDEPVEVALSPNGETLIAANYGSGTVSIIDTRSQSETDRLSLEPDPAWLVASRSGQKAYVLHSLSNTVSVIDLPNRRLQASFSLDESPLRGALNRDGSNLYIVSQYSTDLQIINTFSHSVIGTIFTGSSASSITVDPKSDLVYIGKTTGEVVVVDPLSGMFIDSFQVRGMPASWPLTVRKICFWCCPPAGIKCTNST
jgi:hypothetical protein